MYQHITSEDIAAAVLECGILDIRFLVDLYNKNDIEFDYHEILSLYGTANINMIIYDAIVKIGEKFIEEHQEEIKEILNIRNLESLRESHDLYEIYTNYLDSHIRFKDPRIDALFQASEYEV